MRLSKRLATLIKEAASGSFGDTDIFLFGSRVDDGKKGGDIDLAVRSSLDRVAFRRQKSQFLASLMRKGYDLKIDIVQIHDKMDDFLRSEVERMAVKI